MTQRNLVLCGGGVTGLVAVGASNRKDACSTQLPGGTPQCADIFTTARGKNPDFEISQLSDNNF